jgi:hypothetical protein
MIVEDPDCLNEKNKIEKVICNFKNERANLQKQ